MKQKVIKQKKEKNKKRKLWQYILYACFLIFGSILIVFLPQYSKMGLGGTASLKSLNEICKTYDIEINVLKHGLTTYIEHNSVDSDTPAGKTELFIFRVLPEDKTLDKLKLSSEENADFEFLVKEILGDYGAELHRDYRILPRAPYRWRLIELPTGEHLAIWYQEDDENSSSGYTVNAENLNLLSW